LKFIDSLGLFLQSHRRTATFHLAILSPLRPLGTLPNILSATIKRLLGTELHPELVEQIMTRAQMSADGHERSLIRNIHAELDKLTDRKTAEMLRGDIFNLFKILLQYELGIYTLSLERMRIQLENSSQLS
jgi:hypothetical protein